MRGRARAGHTREGQAVVVILLGFGSQGTCMRLQVVVPRVVGRGRAVL
jgi:hypothetical protein